MITLQSIVNIVLLLIGCTAVFGLLFYVVNYCEGQFPSMGLFCKFARIFLVIAAVFLLIGIIMDTMGHPLIVLR